MRVYQPETPIDLVEAPLPYQSFETLYRSGCLLDLKEFHDSFRRLPAAIENPLINTFRKKMKIRQMRKHFIAAVLLMPAKGHLPGRKSEKRKAVRTQIPPYPAHKFFLVLYMLYNIVTDYQVELPLQSLDRKDVRGHKTALRTFFCKKTLSSLYFPLRHIHTENPAACLSKRQQITALAATYLQNIDAPAYPHI